MFVQVRYSQLRKAQEKLIGDLENCVSRRETIMDKAEAQKQRAHKGSHNTQKKLEDIQKKMKRVNGVGTFVISETGCGQHKTQMLYFWLWATQLKFCIFGCGQHTSNAVFLAVGNTTQILYFWLWTTQLKCCIFGCGQNSNAVFLAVARYCIGVFRLSFREKNT
jgi:hypothetical protein